MYQMVKNTHLVKYTFLGRWANNPKIARQLAAKREVCRRYRARRRTVRVPRVREPFYGVFEPHTRQVYVNDPDNIAGVGALLDAILARERERRRPSAS
jgi:hypothetical protein